MNALVDDLATDTPAASGSKQYRNRRSALNLRLAKRKPEETKGVE
jgi:hypothetical protein